jgi:hypothetical protein
MARPSPLLCLFHYHAAYRTLTAAIDNFGAVLKISDQIEDNAAAQSNNFDYAFFVLIASSMLSLLLGFSSVQDSNRLKFLGNFSGSFSTFIQYNLSKLLYIWAAAALLCAAAFIQLGLYGIVLNSHDVKLASIFFIFTGMVMSFFFLVGSSIGHLKPGFWSIFSMFTLWAILVFILPFIIQPHKTDTTSQFEHEYKKFMRFAESENYLSKELEKIINWEEKSKYFREMSNRYPERVFKQIERWENERAAASASAARKNHRDNIFIPTNLYSSLCRELSSMGDLAKIVFHKYTFAWQKYIVNNYSKNIPIKDIDFVYESKSRFPHYFKTGFFLLAFYLAALLILHYIAYKRRLFPRIKPGFEEVKIEAQKGDHVYSQVGIGYEDFSKEIYNCCFSGKKFTGSITVNGKSIFDLKIFYLPNLAGISLKDLRVLSGGKLPQDIENKSFSELSFQDLKGLFPQIAESDVLILDNTKLRIKPAGDIVILEMSPESPTRILKPFYLVALEDNRYRIKLQNQVPGAVE